MIVFCPSCGNKNDFAQNMKKGYCMRCGKEINCSGLNETATDAKSSATSQTKNASSMDMFAQLMNMTKGISKMLEDPTALDMSSVVDAMQGMADSGMIDKTMVQNLETYSNMTKNLGEDIPFRNAPIAEQDLEDINSMMQGGKKESDNTNTAPVGNIKKTRNIETE